MSLPTIELRPYAPEFHEAWNSFVQASKNGTFLFDRRYMDYHADRFPDASLIAYDGAQIAALLPAARSAIDGADWLVSHPGLTYGGWVVGADMTTPLMLRLFDGLAAWGRAEGLEGMRYKAVPRCYHRLPADEDLYALFRYDARLVRQDLASIIQLTDAPGWSQRRRRALSKARKAGVVVTVSEDWTDFHACLTGVLAAHGATPVHSVSELELLHSRFAEQIHLYAAQMAGEAIAYVMIFDTGQTVHTQYLASRDLGRRNGGLEAIVHRLQFEDYADRRYLSFGASTEQDGRVLNEGLVDQKEMFGGRAMICSTYDLSFGVQR